MKSFFRFIGMLPFIGKIGIKLLVYHFYQSMTASERKQSYLHLIVFLAYSILLHATQAMVGIQALSFNSPLWVKVISGLYAIINICVILTQAYLGLRITNFWRRGMCPRTNKAMPEWTISEVATMLAVTFGGQIFFITLYLWYFPW